MKKESNIKSFIHNSFGWEVNFDSFDSLIEKLPYYLSVAAEYSLFKSENFEAIAIKPKEENDFRFSKTLVHNIEHITGQKAILILEDISSYQRRSLIKERISFIVLDKQLYLPAFGALMTARGLSADKVKNNKLSTIATAILLMYLSGKSINYKNVTELAHIMKYSVKTMSLAVNELRKLGLVDIRVEGRKKIIEFTKNSSDLWNHAKEMSGVFVEKRLFTTNIELAKKIGIKASDSALAEISMLASPHKPIYAVYSRNPLLRELDLNPHEGEVMIEVWHFDPALTAKNGVVDTYALALSYRNDDDPRVKKELDKLIASQL